MQLPVRTAGHAASEIGIADVEQHVLAAHKEQVGCWKEAASQALPSLALICDIEDLGPAIPIVL